MAEGLATFLPAMSAATCRQPGSKRLSKDKFHRQSFEISRLYALATLTRSLVPKRHRGRSRVHRRGRLRCCSKCYRTSWGRRWYRIAEAWRPSASSWKDRGHSGGVISRHPGRFGTIRRGLDHSRVVDDHRVEGDPAVLVLLGDLGTGVQEEPISELLNAKCQSSLPLIETRSPTLHPHSPS